MSIPQFSYLFYRWRTVEFKFLVIINNVTVNSPAMSSGGHVRACLLDLYLQVHSVLQYTDSLFVMHKALLFLSGPLV